MEDLKAQKFGPVCGKHASCTFYKAFKVTKNGKSRVITLGQFFFMKILKGIPVCIGELQLVWEDKSSCQDLASVRLYFLPECTPDGRLIHHGEDEVLAYSEKIVLKLDDLATLVVEDVSWSDGRRAFTTDTLVPHEEHEGLAEAFGMNSFGLDNREVEDEAEQIEGDVLQDKSPGIMIMSFSRYCRYRAILKRLEKSADKWMRHAVVAALGGFHTASKNNRIYFCRDLFDHADLDDFELRCDHLAPNLKGRPRKRPGSKQGSGNGNDSSEDSSCSSSFSSQRDSEGNKIRTGARATPLRNGFRIDRVKVSKDEQAFLIDLHKYMKSRGTPIGRIPSLGFKQIDLYQFYSLAEDIGGYEQISNKRMWKHLYDKLGGNPGFTSAATCTRRHYEKLLLPYERYERGCEMASQVKKKREPKHIVGVKQEEEGEEEDEEEEEEEEAEIKEEVKENIKQEVEIKEEPKLNGHSHIKTEADLPLGNLGNQSPEMKALIIKQEIEKMKMRKDAQKHSDKEPEKSSEKSSENGSEKSSDREKVWEERRKNKLGEKVRKPSGCQKTVRELLDRNGRDLSDLTSDKPLGEPGSERSPEERRLSNDGIRDHRDHHRDSKSDLNLHEKKVPLSLSLSSAAAGDSRTAQSALLSPLSQHHPMFYPHLVPMPGGLRGVSPMAMPFMLPHLGLPTIPNPGQSIHSLGNPTYKDSKPLHALSKLVTEQKDKVPSSSHAVITDHPSAIVHHGSSSSKPRISNPSPLNTPPSAHSQPPKPLTSPTPHTSLQQQRPITPAHSNTIKRSYPYMDKTPPFASPFPEHHKGHSDPSHKRSKLMASKDSSSYTGSSSSQPIDAPVLDLSMKTLRAQEERQQRGESLLFNASFGKENRSSSRGVASMGARSEDAPLLDLSVKSSSKYSSRDHHQSSSSHGSDRDRERRSSSATLNIPHFKSPPEQKSPSTSFSIPVLSESHRRDSKHKLETSLASLSTSKHPLPSLPAGALATIGGLPIDAMGALVHPAFPQQMLMQGIFPTPLQLQQMIQGQVAAGLSGHPGAAAAAAGAAMLRPGVVGPEAGFVLPQSLMFPPALTSMPPSFTTPGATSVKSSSSTTSSGSAGKR